MARSTRGSTKVFVVDDDDAVRDSIKVLLEVHGLEVEEYGSTQDFISAYQAPAHGCLILDHHLPGSSGLDFLASAQGQALEVPVILITGHGHAALQERARELGAAYLEKPVDERTLIEAVDRAIMGC